MKLEGDANGTFGASIEDLGVLEIGLGKLIHELRTKTEFAPAGSNTIIGYILVGIRQQV